MIGASQKESKEPVECQVRRGRGFQKMKATSAAKIRLVLPTAVMRSALLDFEGLVLVSLGFKSPEVSVVCEGEPDIVKVVPAALAVVGVAVVLDCVMENWPV